MTLDEIRKKLDEIDDKLLELINERFKLVHMVGEIKNKNNEPIYRPEREKAILDRLKQKYHSLLLFTIKQRECSPL